MGLFACHTVCTAACRLYCADRGVARDRANARRVMTLRADRALQIALNGFIRSGVTFASFVLGRPFGGRDSPSIPIACGRLAAILARDKRMRRGECRGDTQRRMLL